MLLDEARARTAENKALREEAAKCHKEQAEQAKRLEAVEKELAKYAGGETDGRSSGRHRDA